MPIATETIPKGYKQIELGVIPEDWTTVSLSKLATDFIVPMRDKPKKFGGSIPWCRIEDFEGKYLYDSKSGQYVDKEVIKLMNLKVYPIDTLLVSCSADLGRCAITRRPLVTNQTFIGIFFDVKKASSEFFYYYMTFNSEELNKISSGTTISYLSKEQFKSLKVKVPIKIEEQTAIATVLSDIDTLITQWESLIEKKKNIKQGTMQGLITGKRRLPGFSGKWETKKLGELLDYEQPTEYLVKHADYSDDFSTSVLTAGKTFVLGYTAEEAGIFQNLPTIIFDDFTTAIRYVDFPFKAKSSAMKMLIPRSKKVNLKFVFAKMQMIDFQLGGHKRYWISEYQNIEIATPKPDEQIAIASVLSDMDIEIGKLESQLTKYQNIKQGMMQTLLTGKIRLI